jgi:hypothetical protein
MCVFASVPSATPLYGQVTLFTDRQQFEATVSNLTHIDFASVLAPGQTQTQISGSAGLTLSGVNFQGLPQNFLFVVAPGDSDPYQGWNTNPTVLQSLAPPGTTLVVNLPAGTTAVGTDMYVIRGNPNPPPPYLFGGPVQVMLSSGDSFAIPTFDKPTVAFVGFTSTSPIASLTFSAQSPGGGYLNISNFTFARQTGTACSISSNFNGTSLGSGDFVWFNSVLNVNGLGSAPATISIINSTIQFTAGGTSYNVSVPDAAITFSPTATSATTSFNAASNTWTTTVPSSGLSGNTFLDGLAFPVPTGGLPGGINPVSWKASFSSETSGLTVQWKWAAAAYAQFNTDYNSVGVKPVDDNNASQYQNSDHAGTPENYKAYVVGGARGGGGSNWTGGYSGTGNCAPTP